VLVSSVSILFFIGTDAVRYEAFCCVSKFVVLVSSVSILFFIGTDAVRH